jgi:hypothetical protein
VAANQAKKPHRFQVGWFQKTRTAPFFIFFPNSRLFLSSQPLGESSAANEQACLHCPYHEENIHRLIS